MLSYVYPQLWSDYLSEGEPSTSARLRGFLVSVKLLLVHTQTLIHSHSDTLQKIRSLPTNTYVGFDERDIQDYNLSEHDCQLSQEREAALKSLQDEREAVEDQLRIYLMLVFQMFAEPLSSLRQTQSVAPLTPSSDSRGSSSSGAGAELDGADHNTRTLLDFVDSLLSFSKQLEDERLYALCIHAVAGIDQELEVAPQVLVSPASSPRGTLPGHGVGTQCCTTPVAAHLAYFTMRSHTDLPTVSTTFHDRVVVLLFFTKSICVCVYSCVFVGNSAYAKRVWIPEARRDTISCSALARRTLAIAGVSQWR